MPLPSPIPPEGDVWWLIAPISDVVDARIKLWLRELAAQRRDAETDERA